jgi:hypothetical protein
MKLTTEARRLYDAQNHSAYLIGLAAYRAVRQAGGIRSAAREARDAAFAAHWSYLRRHGIPGTGRERELP